MSNPLFSTPRSVRLVASAVVLIAMSACTEATLPTAPASGPGAPRFAVATTATLTYSSGTLVASGRDTATNIVAYTDPYAASQLGGQTVPFDAYLIARNGAYGTLSGANWIGSYPQSGLSVNNSTQDGRYTYERFITVPENSVGTLSVRLMADNAATVSLDGVQFGQQMQADVFPNFQSTSMFSTPITSGSHSLRFLVRNGVNGAGGPTGLVYVATVTYTCNEGYGASNGRCVELTPPEVQVTVTGDKTSPANSWYTSDVTVTFAVTDPESPFTSSGCETQTVSSDTPGVTFTCSATSEGGTTTRSVTIKRDATVPTVAYAGALATYTVDQMINITCSATDATSGVASNTCANITGPAYSFALGLNTFAATATDNAGNVGTGSVSFNVVATCESVDALVSRFVADARWQKKLSGRLGNLCDKGAKNSPSQDEQLKVFLKELARAQQDGAVSAADAAVLALLVGAL